MKHIRRKFSYLAIPLFALTMTAAAAQQNQGQQVRAYGQYGPGNTTGQQAQTRHGNRFANRQNRSQNRVPGSGACEGTGPCQGAGKGQVNGNAQGSGTMNGRGNGRRGGRRGAVNGGAWDNGQEVN